MSMGTRADVQRRMRCIRQLVPSVAHTPTWGGSFRDKRTLTRGAGTGEVAVRYTPATEGELVVMAANLENPNVATYNVHGMIRESDAEYLSAFMSGNLAQNAQANGPSPSGAASHHPFPPFIHGGAGFAYLRMQNVASGDQLKARAYLRYAGATPTVTEVGV